MELNNFLITILTSASVSGLVTFLLKTYYKAKIEHFYKIELEKYKSQMALKIEEGQGIVTRRFDAYPKTVELIYRTRNMSRDLCSSITRTNISLIDELVSRAKELEDILYKYRIDLERDGYFSEIHQYKNILLNFNMKTSDIKYFMEHNEEARLLNSQKELNNLYTHIDKLHKKIIHSLSINDEQNI